MGTDFWLNILDVVTIISGFLPATKRRELPLVFPNRRGRESAARAGIIENIHRSREDKGSPWKFVSRGSIWGLRLYSGFADIRL
ncbi:hypothetical protein FYR02_17220 [Salmonella enterica]|uniref:Uncharacterized protein n=1 Tax=Salmonella enterica TaxID=28901 RepID=A0A3J2D789_SALER|nr:hypothetical protein [Salmonella enterica]ECU4767500.1 hypothetical protein [Salmonella enterica subsp. enterica]EDQ1016512.1 hypothetical protein [Salmonella enterica subsp. houtenae serovar 50:z4,z23:-]EDV3253425.1 hypothetical protein [Salmonella enterica subsp. houtenae]EDW0440136.1 hypothetical protein [Salmonella enterica subsp. arizonae serovar 50:z4,z23:-]HAE7876053.1 hypothetical protein [Salmonella enterica subsp. enterica serovar 1,9,12:-:-]